MGTTKALSPARSTETSSTLALVVRSTALVVVGIDGSDLSWGASSWASAETGRLEGLELSRFGRHWFLGLRPPRGQLRSRADCGGRARRGPVLGCRRRSRSSRRGRCAVAPGSPQGRSGPPYDLLGVPAPSMASPSEWGMDHPERTFLQSVAPIAVGKASPRSDPPGLLPRAPRRAQS
jgi:hypothetical protein